MLTSKSRAWAEIDLAKVEHNYNEVVRLLHKNTKVMAVVKADAYGHGDVEIAKKLVSLGVDYFCVSSVDEALNLRNAGITQRILILGYTPPMHFHYLVEEKLTQTIMSVEYGEKLNEYCEKNHTKVNVHIKLDTGMSRLGIVCLNDFDYMSELRKIYTLHCIHIEGLFTHFSVSDSLTEDDITYTDQQIELFDKVVAQLKNEGYETGLLHAQNSYGVLNYNNLPYDYARPGILLLGVTSDSQVKIRNNVNFEPIMTLKANVSMVKTVRKGTCVSYGRNYIAPSDRILATVSIGYCDGISRSLSHKGARVLVKGEYAPIAGNICMDQLIIDVTDIKGVKEGDEVVLFGTQGNKTIEVDKLSRLSNTINNETLCRLGARVPKIYMNK